MKTNVDEAGTVAAAGRNAARYAELCEQYDTTVKEAEAQDTVQAVVLTVPLATPSSGASRAVLFLASELFDDENKLSMAKMIEACGCHQSGTTTRSQ